MTNFNYSAFSEELIDVLGSYGISCSTEQAEKLLRHLDLVIEKNKTLNLTRITDPRNGVMLHIVDSLLLLSVPSFASVSGRYLDIGTGAGFPGIPLTVMTDLKGTLIDSVGKKVAAVQEFVRELGLEKTVSVRSIRAEELAKTEASQYDAVVARAVAQTNTIIEYASPLLKTGGKVFVCKANPTSEEIKCADEAAKICGMRNVSRETFELPEGLGHREILVYEKHAKPSIKLPRRSGLAQHEPLGTK